MSEQVGYKLVVFYNEKTKKYYVTGYSQLQLREHPYGHLTNAQDGETLVFDTWEQVEKEIVTKGDISCF